MRIWQSRCMRSGGRPENVVRFPHGASAISHCRACFSFALRCAYFALLIAVLMAVAHATASSLCSFAFRFGWASGSTAILKK